MAPELLSLSGQPEAKFWDAEQGYDDVKIGGGESALNTYPNRALGTGFENGLSIVTNLPPDDLDFTCRRAAQGYKVMLHSPVEIPQPSKNCFRLPHNREILVAVKPTMLETSKELEDCAPDRKLCFFDSEVKLKFFKVYTQQHCELECISHHMKKECGCVFFSYPSKRDVCITHRKIY